MFTKLVATDTVTDGNVKSVLVFLSSEQIPFMFWVCVNHYVMTGHTFTLKTPDLFFYFS